MLEEEIYGFSSTGSDGAVQWGGAVFVLGLDLGAGSEEGLDCFDLVLRIDCGDAVGCVVQGCAGAVVFGGVEGGSSFEEEFHNFNAVAGGGEVQSGVAGVNPVEDFFLVEARFLDLADGQRWISF